MSSISQKSTTSRKLFLDTPNIGDLERQYLNKAVDQNFVSTYGPFVEKFETKFARYLHCDQAVAIQSGTAALYMCLRECGIGPGDEVIVPVLTFVASVNPVMYCGAKPVFVDVEETTWTMDPNQIEARMTSRTKAIIPVHLYGNPCAMSDIQVIAQKYHLAIIEDATESLGAVYKGHMTGTIGDIGCFSFNGNKIMTTGGGGMIVGKTQEPLNHIKYLINQAQGEYQQDYQEIGFNFRLTNLAAALGLAQLERLEIFLEQKRRFNKIYKDGLQGKVTFQQSTKDAQSSWWMTCIRFDQSIKIDQLQQQLQERGIPVRRVFQPVVSLPPYEGDQAEFINAYNIYHHTLCFPSSTLNDEDDIVYICEELKELMENG